MDHEVIVEP
jgi:hypothetical protein